jgi:hypothetical protein
MVYGLLKKETSPQKYIDNINEHAFLADMKGNILALSGNLKFPTYKIKLPNSKGEEVEVEVNELKNFYDLFSKKFRDPNSCCGLRLNKEKYTLIKEEGTDYYFSKAKGGAMISVTKAMIVFASYNTDLKGSDGVSQNVSQCIKAVSGLSQFLKQSGY